MKYPTLWTNGQQELIVSWYRQRFGYGRKGI